ncbi:WD40-repeat-containing domain protein [Blakeslea trispora]|nr:WD40-repeat-containing domain protein [Blakeslea trispora]
MYSSSSSNEDTYSIEEVDTKLSYSKLKTCLSENDIQRKHIHYIQPPSSSISSISNSTVNRNRQLHHSECNSINIEFKHKQPQKLRNTPLTSHERHHRVYSWSGFNETLYRQKINRNSFCSLSTAEKANQYLHFDKRTNPPHGKKYAKIKSRVKINRRFERVVLAQTLAFGCTATEVFTDAGVPITARSIENEEPKQPLDAIWVVRFSKNGKYMATAGQSCVINVWKVLRDTDLSDNILLKDILPHEQSIKVFHDAPVRIYNGHTVDILDLSWSKNNFLLSGSMDKTVRLWHISQATCLCAFRHTDIVTSVRFHPKDDRFFLSGCLDSRVRLWNIPEKRIAFWNEIAHGSTITAAGFTLDGRSVCVGTNRGDVLFYETQGLKYNTQISIKKHRKKSGKKVTGIEPMPGLPAGEERILVTTNDSRIWTINMKDKSYVYTYKGLQNETMQIKASFSDDGRYIICGSEDGCVYMWCTDQVSYSPFQHWKESHLRAAANLYSLGDQFAHTVMQYEISSSQQSSKKLSRWIKKGERQVTDRLRSRNEHFDAHVHTVTAAVFAPLKTRQMLAKSGGDIIFDHTPVVLQNEPGYSQQQSHATRNISNESRRMEFNPCFNDSQSKKSSSSQTIYNSHHCTESLDYQDTSQENFNYPDSHIFVSTDIHGAIKVWRMDSGIYGHHNNLPDETGSSNQKNTDRKSDGSAKKRLISRLLSRFNNTP